MKVRISKQGTDLSELHLLLRGRAVFIPTLNPDLLLLDIAEAKIPHLKVSVGVLRGLYGVLLERRGPAK